MGNITGTTNRDKKDREDRKHGRSGNRRVKYQVPALLMGIMFLGCIVVLAVYFWRLHRAEAELEAMRASYVRNSSRTSGEPGNGSPGSSEGGPGTETDGKTKDFTKQEEAGGREASSGQAEADGMEGAEQPDYGLEGKSVDIAALQEEVNGHIYAWLTIPGTSIDYPIVQHPEEMDYYLDYNLDGSKGRPGGIYTQRMNSKDWTDPNTVIYGHNMRNGTMFADLHKFEDGDFFEENRYIHIYTEDGAVLVYEIFAAYSTDNRHQLMIWNLATEEGFQSYLDAVPEHTGKGCHFREELSPSVEDKILTLSTCVYKQADRRYLVQGVLVAREEQP